MNAATAILRRTRVAEQAIDRGIVKACPVCGVSVAYAYPVEVLICALQGTVTIDASPAHLCIPTPPPVARVRTNPMDALNRAVVDTWSA